MSLSFATCKMCCPTLHYTYLMFPSLCLNFNLIIFYLVVHMVKLVGLFQKPFTKFFYVSLYVLSIFFICYFTSLFIYFLTLNLDPYYYSHLFTIIQQYLTIFRFFGNYKHYQLINFRLYKNQQLNLYMTSTARKTAEQKFQHFDSPQVLNQKVEKVADLISKCKYLIAFTGAGISTSCGIPDFRSGVNTVLKTGPGVWEKRAQGLKQNEPNPNIIDRNRAIPSFTHMSLVALQKAKKLKFLVSQNTDGLHLRSGFNPFNFAELHGNRMLQKCINCNSKFLRDFITRQAIKAHDHDTSRKCQNCGNILYDSIINFGENLPQYEINRSYEQAQKADICIALGSSLTVNPAAQIPKIVGEKGYLIIVNLQATPLDEYAHIRVNAMCDDFIRLLMQKLQVKVDQFLLHRYLQFNTDKNQNMMYFRGIDQRKIPFTYLKQVSFSNLEQQQYQKLQNSDMYYVKFRQQQPVKIKLQFYGWLKQPAVQLKFDQPKKGIMELIYDPYTQKWQQPQWIDGFKQEEGAKRNIKNPKRCEVA